MNEADKAKARYQKKYGKLVPEPHTETVGGSAKKSSEESGKAILLGGRKYIIPEEKKEGLRLVIDARGLGRTETYTFFHPNPEAYIPWQDYGRLREILRLALNTKLPGIR